jgi:hypothetical protein
MRCLSWVSRFVVGSWHWLNRSGLHFKTWRLFSMISEVMLMMTLLMMMLLTNRLYRFMPLTYSLWQMLILRVTTFVYYLNSTIIFNKDFITCCSMLLIDMMPLYNVALSLCLGLRHDILDHMWLSAMTSTHYWSLMMILRPLRSICSIVLCLVDVTFNWVDHANERLIDYLWLYLRLAIMLLSLLLITHLISSGRIIRRLVKLWVKHVIILCFMAMVTDTRWTALWQTMLMSSHRAIISNPNVSMSLAKVWWLRLLSMRAILLNNLHLVWWDINISLNHLWFLMMSMDYRMMWTIYTSRLAMDYLLPLIRRMNLELLALYNGLCVLLLVYLYVLSCLSIIN